MRGIINKLGAIVLLSASTLLLAQSPATVIRNARVVDGTGAPAKQITILIRDGRIAAVGEKIEVPADAKVVDASGLTLLPGLIDLHTHLQNATVAGAPDDLFKNLKKYLAAGVTSVLNFSGQPEAFEPIRKLLKSADYPAPHVYQSARFSPPGGHGTEGGAGGSYEAANPEQAHYLLKEALKYKPDAIKAFTDGWRYGSGPAEPSFNQQTIAAITDEAHKGGIRVFTHTVTLEGAKTAALGNIDAQDHGICDLFADESVIRDYKEHGTGYISTLSVYGFQEYYARHGEARVTPRLLQLLEPSALANAAHSDVFAHAVQITPESRDTAIRRWAVLQQNVRILHAAGIPLGAGTDSGVIGIHHGYATLKEVQFLVDSGLTPLEAIHSATGVNAQLLGVSKDYGTIEVGKVADLVLVEGKPDDNIAEIENTRRVWASGNEVDLAAINAAIKSDALTSLPIHSVPALVFDAEREDGRTNLDTLPYVTSDPAADHSNLVFTRIVRDESKKEHALALAAEFAPKSTPFVRFHIPLTRGSLELADLSAFHGISLDVRGEGEYSLLTELYGGKETGLPAANFKAAGSWHNAHIDFAQLKLKDGKNADWNGKNVREILIEIARPAGSKSWLEIDNVRFY
jgi:imidazolonepropionase-like amidohydrolase